MLGSDGFCGIVEGRRITRRVLVIPVKDNSQNAVPL
jgi:hypothetical protein